MPQVDSNEIPFSRPGRGQRASGANASLETRLNDIVADITGNGDGAGQRINRQRQSSSTGKYVFIFLFLILIPAYAVVQLLSRDLVTVRSDKKVVASTRQVMPPAPDQSPSARPPQSAPVYLFQNTLPGTYNMSKEESQKQNETSLESQPQPLLQQQEQPLTITSDDTLDFGVIKMRNKDGRLMFNPMQRSFVFNNPNDRNMTINNISNPEYPFSIINNCPTVMEPISSCNILVKFKPNKFRFDADIDETEETYKGKLVISTEGGDMTVTLLGKSSLVVERRIENRFDNGFRNGYDRNSYGRRY